MGDALQNQFATSAYNAEESLDNGEILTYPGGMRGGLQRWKRGVESHGVRQAISYAFEGTCDAHLHRPTGAEALEGYSAASDSTVSRFIVENGVITSDELTAGGVRVWLPGTIPSRGRSAATSG